MAIRESKQSEATRAAEESNGQRRHKHMLTAVQIQWRALLLAIVSSGTVVFYWVTNEEKKIWVIHSFIKPLLFLDFLFHSNPSYGQS